MNSLWFTLAIGAGATALTDVWGVVRQRLLGVAPPDYGLVGRWLAHMTHGCFRHRSIAEASPVRGERIIGWTAHYLIGVLFAGVLVGIWGLQWVQNPTIGPALTVGIITVAAPYFLMQPSMGAGIAASRAPNPNAARLHSLITHIIFGVGLYLSARAVIFFE